MTFLNSKIDFIILKTDDKQFTLTTKKSLHIIFKALHSSSLFTGCGSRKEYSTNSPFKVLHGRARRYDLPRQRTLRVCQHQPTCGTTRQTVNCWLLYLLLHVCGMDCAAHAWNGLPIDVILAHSLLTFRRLLKHFFISTIIFGCCYLTLVSVNHLIVAVSVSLGPL